MIARDIRSIPKLIKGGIKNIKMIKKKGVLESIREGVLTIEQFRSSLQEAEAIYNLLQREYPDYGSQLFFLSEATKVDVHLEEHTGPVPVTELEKYKIIRMREKVRSDFRSTIEFVRDVLDSIKAEEYQKEGSYIKRPEDILDKAFRVDDQSFLIDKAPDENGIASHAYAPLDSFSLTAQSMAGARSAAAQGLASLSFSLLEQAQPAGATGAGQFASLGSRTVEDMGFQPAGLTQLRKLADQATATLQAMHPAGAAAAGVGLLALSCLLRGRSGGGKGGSAMESSSGGGAGAAQSPRRPMNVYVEGRRMSSPAELERTLARGGMHPAPRTAYVNLMRYDSVLS